MAVCLRHILLVLALALPRCMFAFGVSAYVDNSVLSSGRWVKIGVDESGVYRISNADLRKWGFAEPAKVRVYGYGGNRLSDRLSHSEYVDDLPMVQSELTDDGIVFYAVGPERWRDIGGGNFIHELNPYSVSGYYYLSDRDAALRDIREEGSTVVDGMVADTYTERLYHELDRVTPAESGHQLLGEDFRFTPSRVFNFKLPGRVENTDVWMQAIFYAKTVSAPGELSFTVNGNALAVGSDDKVKGTADYGDTCRVRRRLHISGSELALGMKFSVSGTVSLAHLDNISLNYTRRLELPADKRLAFSSPFRALRLAGADAGTRVWDVTSPLSIVRMRIEGDGGGVCWKNDYSGLREYVAWEPDGVLPSPRFIGEVPNQNIHGADVPDMVIVSHPGLIGQSERIGELHRSHDGYDVLVVTTDEVYNEFGSGCGDVNAIRRMLKMLYDRGTVTGVPGRLKYVLLMGAANHDHRRLTAAMAGSLTFTVPIWQSDMCISESDSYCSDDLVGWLDDDSGLMNGSDKLRVAVGRIPARTFADAKAYVDRLVAYVTNPAQGEWRNRVLLLADDGDSGVHLAQTEQMERNLRNSSSGDGFMYEKVYLDAYMKRNGEYSEARERMYRLMDDGVVWWNFVGHANINSLTGEGQFSSTDLGNLYLRRPLFFYGATCTFGQWDGSAVSGLEQLVMLDSGGAIGGISAVRKVMIARNGVLTSALGQELFDRDENGHFRSVGEALSRAKNNVNDDNKMRYVFLGDPAMRLAVPDNHVVLESIDGESLTGENQVTVKALGRPAFHGTVRGADGAVLSGFSGWLSVTLYDAERSVTTHGNGDDGHEDIYDEHGDRLYAGRTRVENGEFDITVVLPSEISDNFRAASMNMYAVSDDGSVEAVGVSHDFYVYGYDDSAAPDEEPPVIEYMYMNHDSFMPGGVVDAEPTLVARVSDNVGLNMSIAGVGHQMTLCIDDDMMLADVASRYIPDSDGSSAGEIRYKLPMLSAGNHKVTLKVWDVGGNSASSTVEFFVDPRVAPKIFDVYADANPAVTEANFYVCHNRPDAMLTVKIEVFDMNGRCMWSSSTRGRADMYSSIPVTWDLTCQNGSKVPLGIYIYRATVMGDSCESGEPKVSVMSKRIAVAAR